MSNDGRLEDSERSQPVLPVDLVAVQPDDALLDAQTPRPETLARRPDVPKGLGDPDSSPDARLARVLAAWRREIHAEPVTLLVDTDTALALMPRRRRRGLLAWLRGQR